MTMMVASLMFSKTTGVVWSINICTSYHGVILLYIIPSNLRATFQSPIFLNSFPVIYHEETKEFHSY